MRELATARDFVAGFAKMIVDRAVADADALECAAIGLRIDTDGRTVEEAADVIVARSGWPGRVE